MLHYFDSSFLISIVQKEPDSEYAFNIWQKCETRISSSLLKIEANIVLRRNYAQRKNKISRFLFEMQLADLHKLFEDLFFRKVDDVFEKSNVDYNLLCKCRSLDAIHLATALDISEKYGRSEICICSFDKNMLRVAKELGFETN